MLLRRCCYYATHGRMFLISMGLPNVLSHVDSSPDLAAFFLWFSSPCYVKRRKHCQKKNTAVVRGLWDAPRLHVESCWRQGSKRHAAMNQFYSWNFRSLISMTKSAGGSNPRRTTRSQERMQPTNVILHMLRINRNQRNYPANSFVILYLLSR